MKRERTFAALAVGVFAVALAAALLVPGVLADPGADGPRPPGEVAVAEMAIAPGAASGETAELRLETRLEHRGGPAENVSVRFRAIDADSEFVAASRTVDVGTVDADGEVPLNASLVVPREGSYRIEAVVFRGDRRVDAATTGVSGLEALTPAYADSDVGFVEAQVLPALSVSVDEVRDNRTTLRVSSALTNAGDDASGDLRMTVLLRQADSNVVADRATVDVGTIRPGRTDTVETELTVPAGYNYYVDAVLWSDGVLIDEARDVANLAPEERISANESTRSVEFRVEDFESKSNDERPRTSDETEMHADDTPGFGAVVALLALLAAALFTTNRRSSRP